jgi:hypothetical protein
MDIESRLRQEAEAWERVGVPSEKNLHRAILEHGQAYELDREASAQQPNGKLKECFRNAALAAYDHDDLTYVEGFAHRKDGVLVAHHAWVINEDGKALEVTWRDGGDECGFCEDGLCDRDVDDPEYDEADESTWIAECGYCHGVGVRDFVHGSLEGAQYFGIPVPDGVLFAAMRDRNVWGFFTSPSDIQAALD